MKFISWVLGVSSFTLVASSSRVSFPYELHLFPSYQSTRYDDQISLHTAALKAEIANLSDMEFSTVLSLSSRKGNSLKPDSLSLGVKRRLSDDDDGDLFSSAVTLNFSYHPKWVLKDPHFISIAPWTFSTTYGFGKTWSERLCRYFGFDSAFSLFLGNQGYPSLRSKICFFGGSFAGSVHVGCDYLYGTAPDPEISQVFKGYAFSGYQQCNGYIECSFSLPYFLTGRLRYKSAFYEKGIPLGSKQIEVGIEYVITPS